MRSPGTILIRADAGPDVGVGHVMRCLGLAQAWQDRGGAVAFACAAIPDAICARLRSEGITVHLIGASPASAEDARLTRALAEDADWLIVDGYGFDQEWLRQVAGRARIALWTDHRHAPELPVDLILNQNPHATDALYGSSAPKARLLLGPGFTVLRREFRGPLSRRVVRDSVRRMLVSFGGGAAPGAHQAFLDAADLLGDRLPPTTLLLGHAHPDREAILRRAARHPAISAMPAIQGFPDLVEASDLAISAAGATIWELAALGVPSLALVIADNQEPLAEHLHSLGAGISLGRLDSCTPRLIARHVEGLSSHPADLARMSAAALRIVDGKGADRVCDLLALRS